MNLAWFCS